MIFMCIFGFSEEILIPSIIKCFSYMSLISTDHMTASSHVHLVLCSCEHTKVCNDVCGAGSSPCHVQPKFGYMHEHLLPLGIRFLISLPLLCAHPNMGIPVLQDEQGAARPQF